MRRPAVLLAAGAGVLALSACGGGSSAYCTTLTDNSEVAAGVFNPVIPGMASEEDLDARLDLLEQVQDDVPEELAEDFTTWQGYLETAAEDIETDAAAAFEAGQADDVQAARDALFEHYTGTCMS
jgi:hypothetical protein